MKLKLACADFTFPLLRHDRVLDLISMLEIDAVDVGLFEGRSHLQPSDVLRRPSKSASRLEKNLRDRGLKLADIFPHPTAGFESMAPNHPDRKERQQARDFYLRALDFTADSGGHHVTMVPGIHHKSESRSDSFKRCVEELGWRSEEARKRDIVFGIEAHIGSIVPTPKAAAALVRATKGLTLTLDYTHFTRHGVPDSAIEPLVKFASHFHARGGCKGKLQSTFKQNTVDYRRILKVMDTVGYEGYVGIEYIWIEWERCNEVDNLSETILMRDFLNSIKDADQN